MAQKLFSKVSFKKLKQSEKVFILEKKKIKQKVKNEVRVIKTVKESK